MKCKLTPNCCYWCDYLSCIRNSKRHKGKKHCRHCPIYKQMVKSKAFKTQAKNYEKRNGELE